MAPFTEASIKHNSYSASGLLDQPLVFTIPVFNNMPAVTNHPANTFQRVNTGQTDVTNPEFEAHLAAQGFPESYRQYLRWINARRPNWVFEALHTGLSWSNSVTRQTAVGAIQLTASNPDQRLCQVQSNGNCHRTEGTNWWRPTEGATAFFLDPRNHLHEQRILQFEKLSFAEHVQESHIQVILNNTHMAGTSPLDNNRTFASLFIEAGKNANVSAIHLASLSRLELGAWRVENGVNTVPIAARGLTFTYNNVTYTGLYNFYNIGAFSSSSNPVLRGLVWAAGGSSKPVVTGTILGDLIARGYTVSNNILTGIKSNNTPQAFASELPAHTITFVNADDNPIANNARFGTGSRVTITNAEGDSVTYTIVIYGDITGTGTINSADLLAIRQHLLGTNTLTGISATAADITRNSRINSADLLALRQHLLGIRPISQ
jgi:beta-N-acetylglucosaminidase